MSLVLGKKLASPHLLLASLTIVTMLAAGCKDARMPTATSPEAASRAVVPIYGNPEYELEMNACGNPAELNINDFGLGVRPVKAGESASFVLEAYDAAGNRVQFSCPIKWTVRDAHIASIEGSSTNSSVTLRARVPGFTVLTVTYGGLTLPRSFTVELGDPSRLVLSASSLTLQPTQSAQLTASVFDRMGNRLPDRTIIWESDRAGVASVFVPPLNSATATVSVPENPSGFQATITARVKDWPVGASASVSVTGLPQCYCPPAATCTCMPAEPFVITIP